MRANLLNWNFVTGEKESIYNIAKEYFVNAVEDSLAPGGFFTQSILFWLIKKEKFDLELIKREILLVFMMEQKTLI